MGTVFDNAVKEAKRIEEDCLHTARSNFFMGNFWVVVHFVIGIPMTILAACGAAMAKANGKSELSQLFSIVVATLAALNTFLGPQGKGSASKNFGNNYLALRNKARLFREIEIHTLKSESAISAEIKSLSDSRNKLNKDCPHIFFFAYYVAKRGISKGEANYEVDA